MVQLFWSLKNHLEYWLEEEGITNCIVSGATPGSKCVQLVVFDGKARALELYKKYNALAETKHIKGWMSYPDFLGNININMIKKK